MNYTKGKKGAFYLNDYPCTGVRQFNTQSKLIWSLLLPYSLAHRHCLKISLKALQTNGEPLSLDKSKPCRLFLPTKVFAGDTRAEKYKEIYSFRIT